MIPSLPCPSTSLLIFQNPVLLFPSASPYPCGGDCMCLLLLNCCSAMGLSQRTASGWAGWSMQHMHKWDFLSISDCCWGCVAQQGYLRTQILLYITELSILCAEVGLGCCINRLFHIKHHSLPFSKVKLLSLLASAFLFWWWVCWNFLPIDINRSMWWCNWNTHSFPVDNKHLVNQVVPCWIRCSVYNVRSWME